MTKTLTVAIQRQNAERQLFGARRALGHLVELYDSGRWRQLYKEAAFAEAVRQARQAVEHWSGIVAKSGSDSNSSAV
ncbi:MAG: TIGR03809 family protein [Xanthobacteraceae bacterium]